MCSGSFEKECDERAACDVVKVLLDQRRTIAAMRYNLLRRQMQQQQECILQHQRLILQAQLKGGKDSNKKSFVPEIRPAPTHTIGQLHDGGQGSMYGLSMPLFSARLTAARRSNPSIEPPPPTFLALAAGMANTCPPSSSPATSSRRTRSSTSPSRTPSLATLVSSSTSSWLSDRKLNLGAHTCTRRFYHPRHRSSNCRIQDKHTAAGYREQESEEGQALAVALLLGLGLE